MAAQKVDVFTKVDELKISVRIMPFYQISTRLHEKWYEQGGGYFFLVRMDVQDIYIYCIYTVYIQNTCLFPGRYATFYFDG